MCHMAYYEMALVTVSAPVLMFFGYMLIESDPFDHKQVIYKFTAAMATFLTYLAAQLFQSCWSNFYVMGFEFPSLHVLLAALILALLVSGIWDLWFIGLDE